LLKKSNSIENAELDQISIVAVDGQHLKSLEARSSDERRAVETDYKRRKYDRRTQTFKYERTIHLSDTNMFGSVYFAKFFDLQGEAREEYLQQVLGQDFAEFIQHRYNLVTLEANCHYKGALYLYDNVVVNVQVKILKRAKFKITFSSVRKSDNSCVAIGEQWIGFTSAEGKPIAIPDVVQRNLKNFVVTAM